MAIYTTEDGLIFSTEDNTSLIVGVMPNLITDRSEADAVAVRSLETAIKSGTATEEQVLEYLNTHQKGAYTYADLNRVEFAVAYLIGRLWDYGYGSPTRVLPEWTVTDKPNESDFSRYFGNVAQIRAAIRVWDTTPEAPASVTGLDVNKANALEQILVDVELLLNHIQASWLYVNDIYTGEV